MKFRSMRARMTAGFALAIALLMTLVCGALIGYARHTARRNADQLLDESARAIEREVAHEGHRPAQLRAFAKEEGEELRDHNLALMVVDGRGRIMAQSQKRIPRWPLLDDDPDWRVRAVKFGAETIVVALPWRVAERERRGFDWVLGIVSIIAVAASALGAWVLVGRTLSPIGRLSQQADNASADDLRVRLMAPSDDAEVVQLVGTLNGLLARQAATAQAKGRFYAAASHELRTPLQALSGFLELGLSRERSNEALRQILIEAQEQSHHITTLVQDLLLLNQLEMTTSRPPASEIEVAEVAQSVLSHLQPTIAARHLCLQTSWDDHAPEIVAPWSHLEMLLRNLLENAVKYASEGGKVRVATGQSTLEVWNDCPPLEGCDIGQLFEPFFRPDAARNSQTGGNGLGLTICKALCEANGWAISLTQEAKENADGVQVRVDFAASQNHRADATLMQS